MLLAGCDPRIDVAEAYPSKKAAYRYAWPVAPICKQRLERNPNFGNDIRLRKDGSKRPHLGVDLMPPAADLGVYAANDGVVVENTPARGSGWGHYVVIQHADGLRTLYGHLESPSLLKVGSKVARVVRTGRKGGWIPSRSLAPSTGAEARLHRLAAGPM